MVSGKGFARDCTGMGGLGNVARREHLSLRVDEEEATSQDFVLV